MEHKVISAAKEYSTPPDLAGFIDLLENHPLLVSEHALIDNRVILLKGSFKQTKKYFDENFEFYTVTKAAEGRAKQFEYYFNFGPAKLGRIRLVTQNRISPRKFLDNSKIHFNIQIELYCYSKNKKWDKQGYVQKTETIHAEQIAVLKFALDNNLPVFVRTGKDTVILGCKGKVVRDSRELFGL